LYAINRVEDMELDRRNFVKFVAGGVGGTLLSPLPWKLIDDIAIWTQNWSWVPIPARGRISHVDTVCTLCPGACGITVRKVGDRVVKIEGRQDYPVNRGGICPLGMAGQQILYNEGIRWKSPMKRVGPRGSNTWKEISWTEAIHTLSARIRGLRQSGNPERLAAIDGNQSRSTMALLTRRLLDAIGSPNYIALTGQEDTSATAQLLMQGTNGPVALDLENSDFVLSFGCGLLDGWGAPGRMLHAWGEWVSRGPKERTFVVQIDPKASATAMKADLWVAPFPGTEAALALGIAHVLVKERLCHKEFIENHSLGFKDWVGAKGVAHKGFSNLLLEQYAPQDVESITGVEKGLIIQVARRFAAAKAPIAIAGRGKGQLPGGLYEHMAVHALNALRGRINQKGGVLAPDTLPLSAWPEVERDSVATDGLKKPRIDYAGSPRYPFATSLIHHFSESVGSGSQIDTLLVCSANPIHTVPDSRDFAEALKAVPFIVSLSPFRDETSLMADMILPDHTHLEKMTDIVWPTGIQYPLYALSRPVVGPLYMTRHSGDVIIAVAQKIGGSVADSFQWTNFEEAVKQRAKGLFDSGAGQSSLGGSVPVWKQLDKGQAQGKAPLSFPSMWEDLKTGGCWYMPSHSYGRWEQIFRTPSGRFEFYSSSIEAAIKDSSKGESLGDTLEGMGVAARGDEVYMPHYEETQSGADKERYPLLLFPTELINLASGWIGNTPFLNKTLFDYQLKGDDLFVEVNPKTAAEYGLLEGSRVMLRSRRGELKARIHLFEGAMPGIVFMPVGLGHTAYDRYLKGKGANPYEIIERVEDPLSGQPIWWNTRVTVIKA
jgi:menaquinone reductase, molybdopterin-binding-like subunit